mmetsp:Transcript_32389/g.103272  ORF Transcript_32389/g.103272 Transcript_32389/m.103272 type:complete len:216 (-) Transcript_32389:97-744(-)
MSKLLRWIVASALVVESFFFGVVVPRRTVFHGLGATELALPRTDEIDAESAVTIGTAATAFRSSDASMAMPPATFGDADGYWHQFDTLDGSQVYCRGKQALYHWQQNNEFVVLYAPARDVEKGDVRYTLTCKRFLVEFQDRAFGGELAHDVDNELSHWYFQDSNHGERFLVVELAKDAAYYNWPTVFAHENPDTPNDDGSGAPLPESSSSSELVT